MPAAARSGLAQAVHSPDMIALLTGHLAFKAPTHLTLDVQGVGYEVFIPLGTYYALPNLDEITTLSIHTHLREDAIQLYGFLTSEEKDSFLLLTGVSGIGPKLALSVLSTLPVPDLMSAIQAGDVEKLATVPGIGKKSAGRIALELKEKALRFLSHIGSTAASASDPENPVFEDALSALVNLGYHASDVKEVIKRVSNAPQPPLMLQGLIREALKELARR